MDGTGIGRDVDLTGTWIDNRDCSNKQKTIVKLMQVLVLTLKPNRTSLSGAATEYLCAKGMSVVMSCMKVDCQFATLYGMV